MTQDDHIATAFNALAHPRRVRLFRLLCERPEAGRSLLTLQHATGYKDAPLRHHLSVMERAGLIRRRRTGTTVLHMLAPGQLAGAMRAVDALRTAAPTPARATG